MFSHHWTSDPFNCGNVFGDFFPCRALPSLQSQQSQLGRNSALRTNLSNYYKRWLVFRDTNCAAIIAAPPSIVDGGFALSISNSEGFISSELCKTFCIDSRLLKIAKILSRFKILASRRCKERGFFSTSDGLNGLRYVSLYSIFNLTQFFNFVSFLALSRPSVIELYQIPFIIPYN